MVIWIIGLANSGKTTLAMKLLNYLKANSKEPWVLLDGDLIRNLFDNDLGHTIKDREKNAKRIIKICEFLDKQDINVIVPILSIFPEHQKENRKIFKEYKEIYLKTSLKDVIKWDNKGLYKKALNKEINNVVGIDIEFIEPKADLVLENKEGFDFDKAVIKIIEEFNIPVESEYIYTKNDLLKNPITYEYSLVDEKIFEKFLLDRKKSISYLEKKEKIFNEKKKIIKSKDKIFLKDFLNESLKNINLDKILLLIKRFEVSKKLYKEYTNNFKKITDEIDIINYPLFSLVLLNHIKKQNIYVQHIFLNAILKSNDIISSIKDKFIFLDEIQLAIKSLKKELEFLREYHEIFNDFSTK